VRKVVFAVLGFVTIGACAMLGRQAFQSPVVALRDVRLNRLTLSGGTLDVVLHVYNPNEFRLDANHFAYRLMIDTLVVANGEIAQRTTFQPTDSATVRIPVQFTFNAVGQAGQRLMQTGSVEYRVVGDITVASMIGDRTIPFSSSGRFSPLGGAAR
jgi:LEA14-like dessication related protein